MSLCHDMKFFDPSRLDCHGQLVLHSNKFITMYPIICTYGCDSITKNSPYGSLNVIKFIL
jgi:hypothetical protein